jgi:hypothetical protein
LGKSELWRCVEDQAYDQTANPKTKFHRRSLLQILQVMIYQD